MNSEVKGLVIGDKTKMMKMEIGHVTDDHRISSSLALWKVLDLRCAAALSLLALLVVIFHYYGPNSVNNAASLVSFECPSKVKVAENFDQDSFDKEYNAANKVLTRNMTQFLENFRDEGFDAWGHTYDEVKQGMLEWKKTYFPPNIKSGQSIFESACGIGLNLYMTLEILQDAGITDLVVYGNEYLPFSAQKANLVFDRAAPANAKKGVICAADSADLSFIPPNSFDLVYTGYISPLLDPLNFDKGSVDKNYVQYKRVCEGAKKGEDWKDQKLVDLAQEKQENFFARWVSEMVRIAKPGSAVIIEQLAYPYCEEYWDWGGVTQEWWREAIIKYDMDVDPDSLEFADDVIFRRRYHTFMRKNDNTRGNR